MPIVLNVMVKEEITGLSLFSVCPKQPITFTLHGAFLKHLLPVVVMKSILTDGNKPFSKLFFLYFLDLPFVPFSSKSES